MDAPEQVSGGRPSQADLVRIVAPDGSVEVEILPSVGARIHRLRVSGHDLLRTPDDVRAHAWEPIFWGAYPMAPWANRLDAGVFEVDGRRFDLRPTYRDGTAMHGEAYARGWRQIGDGRWRVEGGGRAGEWPWPYEVTVTVDVVVDGFSVELRLRNRSDARMPGGLGLHPWWLRPVEVAVPAAALYSSNAPSPPRPDPVHDRFDLRGLAEMAPGLDATWTDLTRPSFELRWPSLALTATARLVAPRVLLCAASATDIPATAIEPQTHAPQGLRRLLLGEPDPLAWIAPDDSLTLRLEMTFRTES